MKSPRLWLFAFLAILALTLLGSTAERQKPRALERTASTLAGESARFDASDEAAASLRGNPGALIRANTIRKH